MHVNTARALLHAVVLATAMLVAARAWPQPAPLVAVAANMGGTAEALVDAFRRTGGGPVRLTFGASGNLARQVLRGAPFELFLSADEAYPRRLSEAGLTRDGGTVYALGRLALYLSADSPLTLPTGDVTRASVTRLLTAPALERLAIANPEHAPYGRAARETLEYLGVWSVMQERVVMGENVAQSARFASTRDVQAALLPVALAITPALADGRYIVVPAHWHAPIAQRMVLLVRAGATAEQLYAFIRTPQARNILARHGYTVPGG